MTTAIENETVTKPLTPTVVQADIPSIRDWAISAGYTVGKRGRFPREILEAYATAHGLEGPPAPKTATTPYVHSPIRAWAKENGFDVPARGRFSRDVVKAYNDAHGIETPIVEPKVKPPKAEKIKKARKVAPIVIEPTDSREAVVVKVGGRKGGALVCGFCTTGNHDRCPDVLVNGQNVDHNVKCGCDEEIHDV
jgi:hypothetical protein